MITGYNTDVQHRGEVFHVQTEDKGLSNPCIESLVYVGGQILARKRAGYQRLLSDGSAKQKVLELMERQHRLTIAEIKTGKLDAEVAVLRGEAPPPPAAAAPPPAAQDSSLSDSGPSLDQVILDYLNSEAEQEHLVLMMDAENDLGLGAEAALTFHAQSSRGGAPVPEAEITIKMISTVAEPITLGAGRTDPQGDLRLRVLIPELQRGTAALIATAASSLGSAEIKHLI